MNKVYLLLGTNEGDRQGHLNQALEAIAQKCGNVLKRSSLYQTAAWGLKEQADFLNQALIIETNIAPSQLLTELKEIEKETGRVKTVKWGPRVIDIDILFYGQDIVNLPDLTIPHPFIPQRRFTLAPLNEIAPGYIHPVLNQTIASLLETCPDTSKVTMLA